MNRVNGCETHPIRSHEFSECGYRNIVPRLNHTHLQILCSGRPTAIAIADRLHHPGPDHLDEVQVRGVGRSRRQTVELAGLFGLLRLLVLLAFVPSSLIGDEPLYLRLLGVGGGVPDDACAVVAVTLADIGVVVRTGVVLDDVAYAEACQCRVECIVVDLQGFSGILHRSGWLQVGTDGKNGAGRIVPFLDFSVRGAEPVSLRWGYIGKREVIDIRDGPVARICPRLYHTINTRFTSVVFVLEQCSYAKVLGVAKGHLLVAGRPSNSRGLAVPTNPTPKVYTLLDAAFFAFVP